MTHFHKSYKSADRLKTKQQDLKLPKRKLIQDEPTRWNSTFLMMECLLQQQQAVAAVLLESTKTRELLLGAADLTAMEAVVKVMEPFA